jgi:excinuclease ABC subunit A
MHTSIHGASEHNLQDVDVEFGDGLTVVTGVSGSGKTSLVFDTLYHEARRRFIEVFALGSTQLRLSPARVRSIDGLGPAMSVGQNLLNRNPNSTSSCACYMHVSATAIARAAARPWSSAPQTTSSRDLRT